MEILKFNPIFKPTLWGSETWVVSAVAGSESVVLNGEDKGMTLPEVVARYGAEFLGKKNTERFGTDFPLLIKFIDARQDLSIQVHPDDALAAERHDSYGKTEMWYITSCEEGAAIYIGFNREITREEYLEAVSNGSLTDMLNRVEVKAGDAFFIPAGMVHALGKGVQVVEIQQTSDVTYRIYDWNRTDDKGNPRELHTALAVDAIDFESGVEECRRTYTTEPNKEVNIVDCDFFKTDMLVVDGVAELNYCKRDSFTIYMCIEGETKVSLDNGSTETLRTGEVMLIPAIANEVTIEHDGKTETVYIAKGTVEDALEKMNAIITCEKCRVDRIEDVELGKAEVRAVFTVGKTTRS